ncbi:MAG: cupin domain-containing protein [Hyphomicrobiaceae bacterium]
MAMTAQDHRPAGPVKTLADLETLAARIQTSPGWIAREEPIFWPEPASRFVPAHWRADAVRDALEHAGRLVDMALAERRILALRNPFPGNNFATTRTLSCSYQLMLPGERARTHRHASHALRVILDARKSWSIVDGVRMPMETGDIVLTPGGSWHGHGHDGDDPAFWLDGLDIPLTQLLEPMFFEPHPDGFEPTRSVVETSPFRFRRADIARLLDAAAPDDDGLSGPRITLDAPAMAPMGLTVERLGAGQHTRRQRSTASRCYVVMAGAGKSTVGDHSFDWSMGDTIAVPTWAWYAHQATADAQLFCLSDEPLMRFAGYWRHQAE